MNKYSNSDEVKISYEKDNNSYTSDKFKKSQVLPKKNKDVRSISRRVAVCGVFGALALLLYLVEIFRVPLGFIFQAAPFLKLNFSDIPIMIAGFCYGPIVGIIIVIIKFFVKCMITTSGFTGEIADLIVSIAYILPAAIIYKFHRTKKGALLGLITGSILSVIVACLTNAFILLPMYHWKANYAYTIFAGILPFNLFKNILISVIVFLIYKRISNIINKFGAK